MQLNKTKEKEIEDIQQDLKDKKINHPFEDDLLDLKSFAETISNIVISTKDPFVFSINSPYGTGKTFFLRRLHCLLEQKGCMCVSYNAWESDFYDNPLPAIINALERQTLSQKVADNFYGVKNFIKKIFFIYSESNGVPLEKIIKTITPLFKAKEKIYDDLKKYQKAKEKFKKDLSVFVKSKKLVFIIDELDRCRPDYAIKTLEVIKHFFNIPNVNFIIGVDRKQIESTVKVLYGSNIDNNCDEYLRKFIDQDFYLPHSSIEQYINVLCKKYLTESLTGFIREYITDYRLHYKSTKIYSILNTHTLQEPISNIISDSNLIEILSNNIIEIIVEYVCALSEFFSFSLRTQAQFILFLKLFFKSLDIKQDPLYPELACLLTAIRLNDYNHILTNNLRDIFSLIANSKIDGDIQQKIIWAKFENKTDGGVSRLKLDKLIEKTSNRYTNNLFIVWRDLLFNYINTIDYYRFSFSPYSIKKYLDLITQLTLLTTENK